jgi:predicted trehalose synthase
VLHATPFSDLPVELPADHLESTAKQVRLLGTVVPRLAPRLNTLVNRLAAGVPADDLVSSHGGFHLSQLLLSDGELAVVDFDGMCSAPAADDIKRTLRPSSIGRSPACSRDARLLLGAYRRRRLG